MNREPNFCQGFEYISAQNPHWMILGTMPSVESLNQAFYYAHPRNAFWPIMHSLTQRPINTQQEKERLIKQAGLVLWDVLQSCQRQGSLDSDIKEPQANDFESLLSENPTIKTICFNGKKAEQLFKRHVLKRQRIPQEITYIVLPSTSPANATITVEDKWLFWQENLSHLV
ncbi:DNA-deoxyinosine glycosylase [Thiomicrorhabdus immobilis]|uniref:DNA-deoxyinosine glycosylase n=1 Tax=Thiomicrorhabdus immobilis TaxID=2791037 RepID=A0ABN6CWH7_9GAMM|nr:DNA-deoxyinosine glycosylase [Thiomicrorhabdus immobilis]BCN93472.1 DNA-deoxyinosine glycosylase [Thiomicrorhabdus immobilis]